MDYRGMMLVRHKSGGRGGLGLVLTGRESRDDGMGLGGGGGLGGWAGVGLSRHLVGVLFGSANDASVGPFGTGTDE